MSNKLSSISIDDVPVQIDCSAIKDYIISNGTGSHKPYFLKKATIIEGVVFLLCTEGNSIAKINSRTFTIKRGTLLTLLPGCICESIICSEDYSYEYMFFSVDFMTELYFPFNVKLLEIINQSPLVNLTKVQFNDLIDFHAFIVKHYKKEDNLYRVQLAKNLLASFMTEVCDIYSNSQDIRTDVHGRKVETCRLFFRLLLEYIKSERTIQFYADKLCVTPKYLSQLVKEISGKPISEWINGIIIVIIKSMLKKTKMTISQISEELKFPSSSFFCRYFKKQTGITPSQYRDRLS